MRTTPTKVEFVIFLQKFNLLSNLLSGIKKIEQECVKVETQGRYKIYRQEFQGEINL